MIYWMEGKEIQAFEVGDNPEEAVKALGLSEENRLALLSDWNGGDIYVGYDPYDIEIRGEYTLISASSLDGYQRLYDELWSEI